ncbi:MAG: sensor histidine kinase N-terminal domain-containing protein [Delftia acidovorans]|jgi:signal transduction histidine kinase|nr:sensor histidine kinase N-terminal domain-containing protein [Delftia acidovorans]
MMRSLRVRLLACLCLALCTLWGGVAAWMFSDMRNELRTVLDDRLIASARMVAGIVHQFRPARELPQDWSPMLNVIARDGVACEVSLVRGEVQPVRPESALPQVLAKTEGSPVFQQSMPLGFSTIIKGGKLWRTYVLEDHGVRIATADRIDVREGLIHGFAYTIVLPFVLALLASMGLMWWAVTQGLRPLEALRRELARRPPGDDSPVAQGLQTRELAPLVGTLNQLLHRVRAAIDRERRWSDDAAHELRTPLTAIKTHVQVAQMALAAPGMPAGLLAAPPGSMARDSLAQAGEGVEHLQHTLEQLLLLARLEQHEPGAASALACGDAPADALQALDKAWQLAVNAVNAGAPAPAQQQWLDTHQQPGNGAWLLAVSEPLLVSALRNLLENALRHAPQHPVELAVRPIGAMPGKTQQPGTGYVEFTVADHGPGLSAEECEEATRRFWRKRPQEHGSGLGLPIVQRIAECASGCLLLQPRSLWRPEEGQARGLVARLYLPLADGPGPQAAAAGPLTPA